MLPTKETKHVETARKLLIDQFKGRPFIQGYLDVLSRRVQELENVLWDIIEKRRLDVATGIQLDVLGKLVGERRIGRNDTDYRTAIRLRIRVNRSKGRIVDIIDVAILAAGAAPPRVTEYRFLGFEVEIYLQTGERYIADLLSRTRAATSYGMYTASDLPFASVLAFDDAVAPVAGIETFSDGVSSTGKVAPSGYGLPTDFSGIVLASAPPFDVVDLFATLYLKDFSVVPWVGSPSAGTSAAHDFISGGSSPTVGASFGAHPSADFDGTQFLNGGDTLGDLITVSAYTLDLVAEFDAAAAPAGAGLEYTDPAVFADVSGGEIFVTFTSAGVSAGHYNNPAGYGITTPIPLAPGVKASIQVVYDGTDLKCRVNGKDSAGAAGWESVAIGHMQGSAMASTPVLGASYSVIGKINGRIARGLAFATALSAGELDDLYADAQTNYSVP